MERTRLDVASTVADAYLTLLAAQQTQRAAEAQRDRAATVDKIISALVNSDLRPGADLSRSRAEIPAADPVIQAERAVAEARITLEEMTGAPLTAIETDLSKRSPGIGQPAGITHPALVEQRAALEEARARIHALDRVDRDSWRRRPVMRGAPARTRMEPPVALWPASVRIYQNRALGMTVTFPALELPSLRARKAIEQAHVGAEQAREQQIDIEIRVRARRAEAALDAAVRIAAQTPAQLEAARAGERQARARYQSGLANLTELADAQRLLTASEIDDALARLNVWRAMLALASARGDLQPFLSEVAK